jgi:acetyltransferase-like isoleucine patch superfamily enzyme
MSHVLARPPTGANDEIPERSSPSDVVRTRVLSRFFDEARHALSIVEVGRTLWSISSIVPEFVLPSTRAQALRLVGCDIRRRVSVFGHIRLIGPRGSARNLRVGPDSLISQHVTFCLDAPITIGSRVSIGPHAMLYTATHALGLAERRMSFKPIAQPIVVEDGAWVGLAAVILPGVRIGRSSVVSAGAVVTKDVPPNRIVAGNPAEVTAELPED